MFMAWQGTQRQGGRVVDFRLRHLPRRALHQGSLPMIANAFRYTSPKMVHPPFCKRHPFRIRIMLCDNPRKYGNVKRGHFQHCILGSCRSKIAKGEFQRSQDEDFSITRRTMNLGHSGLSHFRLSSQIKGRNCRTAG